MAKKKKGFKVEAYVQRVVSGIVNDISYNLETHSALNIIISGRLLRAPVRDLWRRASARRIGQV